MYTFYFILFTLFRRARSVWECLHSHNVRVEVEITGNCFLFSLLVILLHMYLKLKVIPNSKKETFTKISDDHFEIRVTEPAEQNRANTRVLALLRAHFGGQAKAMRIVSGHHSPSKIISVDIAGE